MYYYSASKDTNNTQTGILRICDTYGLVVGISASKSVTLLLRITDIRVKTIKKFRYQHCVPRTML